MEFLDKLYESNYFGIGLFAVISFLVVTFLVVLFFGKKDEKKRKLEETNSLDIKNNDAFKEVSVGEPLEVPVMPNPVEPVAPISLTPVEPVEVTPIAPINPLNFDNVPLKPVAPINLNEEPAENNFVDNLSFEEPKEVEPIMEPITPISIAENETIEPVRLEPTRYETPVEPKVMEPIKINIPEEPINIEPLIKEEESPILTPVIEEPVIKESYYEPIEKVEPEEIKVPNIDFDAIAKSISQELDELEKSTNRKEEVKVTPISEITEKRPNQFSSVYVNTPVQKPKEVMDLPKKIDLPTMKNDEIEPESYNI